MGREKDPPPRAHSFCPQPSGPLWGGRRGGGSKCLESWHPAMPGLDRHLPHPQYPLSQPHHCALEQNDSKMQKAPAQGLHSQLGLFRILLSFYEILRFSEMLMPEIWQQLTREREFGEERGLGALSAVSLYPPSRPSVRTGVKSWPCHSVT